jgi:hypothetical protein
MRKLRGQTGEKLEGAQVSDVPGDKKNENLHLV